MSFIRACLAIPLALLVAETVAPAAGDPIAVVRVVDGDTVLARRGGQAFRVRLLGIDAPEIGRDGRPDEPGARAALDLVRFILRHARSVELEVAGDRVDDYGRTLGFLWVRTSPPGRPVNVSEELLRRGLATAIRKYNYPEKSRFLTVEAEARRTRRGLWRK